MYFSQPILCLRYVFITPFLQIMTLHKVVMCVFISYFKQTKCMSLCHWRILNRRGGTEKKKTLNKLQSVVRNPLLPSPRYSSRCCQRDLALSCQGARFIPLLYSNHDSNVVLTGDPSSSSFCSFLPTRGTLKYSHLWTHEIRKLHSLRELWALAIFFVVVVVVGSISCHLFRDQTVISLVCCVSGT